MHFLLILRLNWILLKACKAHGVDVALSEVWAKGGKGTVAGGGGTSPVREIL